MADIVNLRTARKRAARREHERTAAENRARHGLGKAEKLTLRTEERRRAASLDSHRLDREDGDR